MNATASGPAPTSLISEGRIAAIGPDLPAPTPAVRCIDARGMLAMPGLINAHFHLPGNFLKGLLDGCPLEVFMLYEVSPLAQQAEGHCFA